MFLPGLAGEGNGSGAYFPFPKDERKAGDALKTFHLERPNILHAMATRKNARNFDDYYLPNKRHAPILIESAATPTKTAPIVIL